MDCLRASARLDKLLLRYGLTRHPKKGVWSGGSQVLQHLGFVIDSVRGSFGVPASKLGKGEQYDSGVIEAGQMHCPQGIRSRARVVRWQSSKPQADRPENGVQAEGPPRRYPPAGTFDRAVVTPLPIPPFLFPLKVPGIRFPIAIRGLLPEQVRAPFSSCGVGPPVLERPSEAPPSPPYMSVPSQPHYHHPYRLFSQRLWRYVGTRSPRGGERRL
jgi:hypothetical protein